MKWSILIPTLNEPESIRHLQNLRRILEPQLTKFSGQVELRFNDAPRSMPTGTKRNQLIANSDGEYFSQIDVDDWVSNRYVSEGMRAIESNPDCVNFKGWMTTNGLHRRDFIIKLGSPYEERNNVYYRWPNHLSIMKREKVERVKFQAIWVQEDYWWSREIMEKKLLKTEVFINQDLYHYQFCTNKPAYQHGRPTRVR